MMDNAIREVNDRKKEENKKVWLKGQGQAGLVFSEGTYV